jgi:hypothetical protein
MNVCKVHGLTEALSGIELPLTTGSFLGLPWKSVGNESNIKKKSMEQENN